MAASNTPASERSVVAAAFAAIALFIVSWTLLHVGFYKHKQLIDTPVYQRYGNAIADGKVPYRDFELEYPPGALPVFALPGLALVTGRADVAKNLLLAFVGTVDQGMLPNRFPTIGATPEYDTVDATLWFFEAIRALWYATRDDTFIRTYFYDTLTDIIDWHMRGTRYGIKVDEDGLLAAGEPGMPLTWMNARVGDWVVTPRHGKRRACKG